MSAGTGITHSEYNGGDYELRLMQMWILPDKKGHMPNYGDQKFAWEALIDKWLPIAAGHTNRQSDAPIKIHADANVYAAYISAGCAIDFELNNSRQAYLVLLEGDATVENIKMTARDALEIIGQSVTITAIAGAHLYVIDLPRD